MKTLLSLKAKFLGEVPPKAKIIDIPQPTGESPALALRSERHTRASRSSAWGSHDRVLTFHGNYERCPVLGADYF